MGNEKVDSNMELLIVLKIASKFGKSSLQGITEREHTREQARRNLKSNVISFSNIF